MSQQLLVWLLFGFSALVYQFDSGKMTLEALRENSFSVLFPFVWVVCFFICYLAIRTAVDVHREMVGEAQKYRAALVGYRPLPPNPVRGIVAASSMIVIAVVLAFAFFRAAYKVKTNVATGSVVSSTSQPGSKQVAPSRADALPQNKPEAVSPIPKSNQKSPQSTASNRLLTSEDADNVVESLWLSLELDGLDRIANEFRTTVAGTQLGDRLRSNPEVRSVPSEGSVIPADWSESIWKETLEKLLPCEVLGKVGGGIAYGISSGMSLTISKHPYLSLDFLRNPQVNDCALRIVVLPDPSSGYHSISLLNYGFLFLTPMSDNYLRFRTFFNSGILQSIVGYPIRWKSFIVDEREDIYLTVGCMNTSSGDPMGDFKRSSLSELEEYLPRFSELPELPGNTFSCLALIQYFRAADCDLGGNSRSMTSRPGISRIPHTTNEDLNSLFIKARLTISSIGTYRMQFA